MPPVDQERLTATVRGRVQGVGFRYATEQKARQLNVTGWVRNQPDHSVYVVAEGSLQQLTQLLEYLHKGPSSAQVITVDAQWHTASGEFQTFRMRMR